MSALVTSPASVQVLEAPYVKALWVPGKEPTLINWQGPEILDGLPLGDAATWAGQAGTADMSAVTAGEIVDVGGVRVLQTVGASSEYYTLPDDPRYVTQHLSIGMAFQVVAGGVNTARLVQGEKSVDMSWFFQLSVHATPSLRLVSWFIASNATDITFDDNATHTKQAAEWVSIIAVFDGTLSASNRVKYWEAGVALSKAELTDPPTTVRDSADLPRLATWEGHAPGGFDSVYWRALIIDGQSWNAAQVVEANAYLTASFS